MVKAQMLGEMSRGKSSPLLDHLGEARACTSLGWAEISTRTYRDLTENEKREIELEENIRRKDLTALELSRNLVALAETAARVDKVSFVKPLNERNKNATKAGSLRRVAERIGFNRLSHFGMHSISFKKKMSF
jgi:AraC-like DNA-binding protein